jgi:hypothetical protein
MMRQPERQKELQRAERIQELKRMVSEPGWNSIEKRTAQHLLETLYKEGGSNEYNGRSNRLI